MIGTLGGTIYASLVGVLIPHEATLAVAGVLALTVAPLAGAAAFAPFTAAMVLLLSSQLGEGPIESGLYRTLEVAMGGAVAVVRVKPCQRALTHHQPNEECAHPSRGPGIQATSAQGARASAGLRTAEGTGLPANIIEELRRDMARLALVREQSNSIEKTRAERLERAPDTGPHAMVRLLARVIGIGIRDGGYAGAGDPVAEASRSKSGGALRRADGIARRERFETPREGPAKAGNARVRRGLIQLAWRFLVFQKDSTLARWYRTRTEGPSGARKTTMIVAMARK
jgi:hypothetical protein